MIIKKTNIEDLFVIENEPVSDERGLFSRVYCKRELAEICNKEFVQFNHSVNIKKGTLRGLHYQKAPYNEAKLIRCIQGSVFDVAIDLRQNSPTFLNFFSIVLSKENWNMIYIPDGFAHGFQTLENNTELLYFHTAFYNSSSEAGIHPMDKTLNINWPVEISICSKKDLSLPMITSDFIGF